MRLSVSTFASPVCGKFWLGLPYIVTYCVNIICLSQLGSESPLLRLFHSLKEDQMATPPRPNPPTTQKNTDTVSFCHNGVVIRQVCICMGRACSLASFLFAAGVVVALCAALSNPLCLALCHRTLMCTLKCWLFFWKPYSHTLRIS